MPRFDIRSAYTELLHMRGRPGVLMLVQTAIESGEVPGGFIHSLLADGNWRSHIVGAGAVLLHEKPREFAQSLWSAIDAGSWVSPQLVVTVFLIDPEFVEQAKRRIELGCPVSSPEGLSPLHRHVVTGSGGATDRSSKNAASLLGMLGCFESEAAWVATQRSHRAIKQLLESNWDAAGDIANRWLCNVRHQFSQFGVGLTLPTA